MGVRINRPRTAPSSYTSDYPLQDRLAGLLGFAVATGRMRDEEADYIARLVSAAQADCSAAEGEAWAC